MNTIRNSDLNNRQNERYEVERKMEERQRSTDCLNTKQFMNVKKNIYGHADGCKSTS